MTDYDPIPLIIEEVARPVERDRADRPGRGVDLGPHEDALRRLLHDAHEVYRLAMDDHATRADPDKPRRRLQENWDPDESKPTYDYGEDAGVGLDDWDEWWQQHYHRRAGNPGTNRTSTKSSPPPVTPLHAIYTLTRRWWKATVGTPFRPTYPRDPFEGDENPRTDFARFNPAGRLFLLVAKSLDRRYTALNCYGVHETVPKKK